MSDMRMSRRPRGLSSTCQNPPAEHHVAEPRRTHGASLLADVAPALRRTLTQVVPDLPTATFRPLRQIVDRAIWLRRFFVELLVAFAGAALALAAIGIYGVVSLFGRAAHVRDRRADGAGRVESAHPLERRQRHASSGIDGCGDWNCRVDRSFVGPDIRCCMACYLAIRGPTRQQQRCSPSWRSRRERFRRLVRRASRRSRRCAPTENTGRTRMTDLLVRGLRQQNMTSSRPLHSAAADAVPRPACTHYSRERRSPPHPHRAQDSAACAVTGLVSAASAKATARLAVVRLKLYASEGGPTTDVGARRRQCEAGTRPERFLAATSHRAIRAARRTQVHRCARPMSP